MDVSVTPGDGVRAVVTGIAGEDDGASWPWGDPRGRLRPSVDRRPPTRQLLCHMRMGRPRRGRLADRGEPRGSQPSRTMLLGTAPFGAGPSVFPWQVEGSCSRSRRGQGFGPRSALIVCSLSLIHISEPTRLGMISYAVFCLK